MRRALSSMKLIVWIAILVCGVLVALACKQPQGHAPEYALLVVARTDEGDPLAHVRVSAEGRDLGETDEKGELRTALRGSEGQRVQLKGQCPARYEGPIEEPTIMLRRFANVDPNAEQRTTVQLACAASERVKVIAVRTGKPNIPVLLRGEVVAQTNVNGTAHVLLREHAGAALQLTLDTRSAPELRPASPTRMFAIDAHDDFAVWDQTFEAQAKKPAKRAKKAAEPAPPPPKPVPYRLD